MRLGLDRCGGAGAGQTAHEACWKRNKAEEEEIEGGEGGLKGLVHPETESK